MKILNIGKDFSLDPSGRYYTDDEDSSGEEFREDYLRELITSLEPGEKLQVVLDDGVEGYGSSFLVEGFAGMVKYGYMTGKDLLEKIDICYTDKDFKVYKNKIVEYITMAKFKSKVYVSTK